MKKRSISTFIPNTHSTDCPHRFHSIYYMKKIVSNTPKPWGAHCYSTLFTLEENKTFLYPLLGREQSVDLDLKTNQWFVVVNGAVHAICGKIRNGKFMDLLKGCLKSLLVLSLFIFCTFMGDFLKFSTFIFYVTNHFNLEFMEMYVIHHIGMKTTNYLSLEDPVTF